MRQDYTYRTAVEKRSYWGDSWDAIDVVAFRTKRQGLAVWRFRATTFNRQWSSKAFLSRECVMAWLYANAFAASTHGTFRLNPRATLELTIGE
jgi:hypothetical protein